MSLGLQGDPTSPVIVRLYRKLRAEELMLLNCGVGDLLENGKVMHCSILAWRIPWTVRGCKESETTHKNKFNGLKT